MKYIAISRNIKITPRKMRLVADGVKRQNIKNALASLSAMNKRAAGPIKKAIDSAIANAANNFKAAKDDLVIREIIIDEGVVMKRYHYAGRGRARPYKRKTSHIRVVLSDGKDIEDKILNIKEKKEEKGGKTKGIKE